MGRSTVLVTPLLIEQALFDGKVRIMGADMMTDSTGNPIVRLYVEGADIPDVDMVECIVTRHEREFTFRDVEARPN